MINKLYQTQFRRMVFQAQQFVGYEAEDIVQESFIKMLEFQHLEYTPAVKLLTVIVRNKCLDNIKRRRVNERMLNWMADQVEPKGNEFDFNDNDADRFLRILSGRSRQCIDLKYVQGYRVKEIAKVLGTGHSSVSVSIHRGLQKLKTVMEHERRNSQHRIPHETSCPKGAQPGSNDRGRGHQAEYFSKNPSPVQSEL